jgi:hypothetical protein
MIECRVREGADLAWKAALSIEQNYHVVCQIFNILKDDRGVNVHATLRNDHEDEEFGV